MPPTINPRELNLKAVKSFVEASLDTDDETIIDEDILRKALSLKKDDLTPLMDKLNFSANGKLERDCVLFMGSKIPNEYSGSYIKLVKGKKKKEVHGCLFDQAVDVFELLEGDFQMTQIVREGAKRTEKSVYPPDALREIVMNAISHKDYDVQVPVQIHIGEHSLRVSNPGTLPSGWSIERIRNEHESFPKNQKILRAFSICHFVEHEGGGIDKIIKDCKKHRTFPPVFEVNKSSFSVTLFFDSKGWLKSKGIVNEKYLEVIEYVLMNESISKSQAVNDLDISDRSASRYLSKDLSLILKSEGKGKNTKYVLREDIFNLDSLAYDEEE